MNKDIVFGNYEFAKKLGYKLVIIGKDAYIAKNSNDVSKNRSKYKYILAEDNWGFNDKRVDIIFNLETGKMKDFMHHRASGLNDVFAKQAKANKISICFNIGLLKSNKDVILGRMMQNVRICRKYKINMILSSFATNEYEMKGTSDIKSLGVILGMHPSEAKKALNW